ncbi:MAG: HisA/HisF-related TIM barrel protein, partial [Bacillota bacterium]
VARRLMGRGVGEFIYTDIERDGTGDGPDLKGVERLASLGCSVIASGGVGGLEDLRRLAAGGARGAIVGRALYEGSIDLREAIETLSGGHDRVVQTDNPLP